MLEVTFQRSCVVFLCIDFFSFYNGRVSSWLCWVFSAVCGSVAVARGLSCPEACGIFPGSGLTPHPPALAGDSKAPLDPQGSSCAVFVSPDAH